METRRLRPAPGAELVVDHLPGQGLPIVYLHGLGSVRVGEKSESVFASAARQGRPAWRFDFRGHGQSSGELGDTTLSELIEDARCVLTAAGRSRVFGSSLGGLVAAWAAATHPELVDSLILLAPAFRFLPRMQQRMSEGHTVTLDHADQPLHLSDRVLADLARHDENDMARAIRCPVYIAHGSLDDTVPPEASAEFVQHLTEPRHHLWVIDGGDHRLNVEAPEILARGEAWLDRLPGS